MNEQQPLRKTGPEGRWDFTGATSLLAQNVGVGMMDLDAVLHRLSPNNRFAFFEKKWQGEAMSMGEKLTLKGLAKLPNARAFKVTYMKDGTIELRECKGSRFPVIETVESEEGFGWWLTMWWHEDDN